VHNATHAFFSWNRHACGSDSSATYHQDFSPNCSSPGDNSVNAFDVSDETWFVRPSSSKCPNRHFTTSYIPADTSSSSDGTSADSSGGRKYTGLETFLIIALGFSTLVVVVLGVVLYRVLKKADDKQPLLADDNYGDADRDNTRIV
jgi:hypothetical protein